MQTLTFSLILPVLLAVNYHSPINANVNLQKQNSLPAGIRREASIIVRPSIKTTRTSSVGINKASNGRIIFPEDNDEPLLPYPVFPPYPARKLSNTIVGPPTPRPESKLRTKKPSIIATSTTSSIVTDGNGKKTTPKVHKSPIPRITQRQRPQKFSSTIMPNKSATTSSSTAKSRQTTPRAHARESDKSKKSATTTESPPNLKEVHVADGSYYVPFKTLKNETNE